MRGESAYLATRTGCAAVIGRMPQFHADKLPVLPRRIPVSTTSPSAHLRYVFHSAQAATAVKRWILGRDSEQLGTP